MNSLPEITFKLTPVISTALDCYGRHQQLFPLQDAIYNMQMATYWFRAADGELLQLDDNSLSHGEVTKPPTPPAVPTLIGTPEYFKYMLAQLKEINKELQHYTDNASLPPLVLYRTRRGYDKTMEAMFNMELANNYYGQINGRS